VQVILASDLLDRAEDGRRGEETTDGQRIQRKSRVRAQGDLSGRSGTFRIQIDLFCSYLKTIPKEKSNFSMPFFMKNPF